MPTLETAPTSAVPELMLQQTRVIRAPRSRVYQAWTNPEIMKQWFGPANMHCTEVRLDVRVGGKYRVQVVPDVPPSDDPNRSSSAEGEFTKVVPNELLQFTWVPSWRPEEQSLVTVSLRDLPDGTQITILHEKFATEVSREGHRNGWAGALDKLAASLES